MDAPAAHGIAVLGGVAGATAGTDLLINELVAVAEPWGGLATDSGV